MNSMAFPPDDKKPMPPSDKKPDVGAVLDEAEAGGKLDAIKAVLDKMGRDDVDAKEVLKLAQKEERTRGKPPEEIASMIESDEGLLDDLVSFRKGGALDRAFGDKKGAPMPKKDEDTAEEEPPTAPGPSSMGMM